MPIEIRELVIRARVGEHSSREQQPGNQPPERPASAAISEDERQSIIEECLERLIRELETRHQW